MSTSRAFVITFNLKPHANFIATRGNCSLELDYTLSARVKWVWLASSVPFVEFKIIQLLSSLFYSPQKPCLRYQFKIQSKLQYALTINCQLMLLASVWRALAKVLVRVIRSTRVFISPTMSYICKS